MIKSINLYFETWILQCSLWTWSYGPGKLDFCCHSLTHTRCNTSSFHNFGNFVAEPPWCGLVDLSGITPGIEIYFSLALQDFLLALLSLSHVIYSSGGYLLYFTPIRSKNAKFRGPSARRALILSFWYRPTLNYALDKYVWKLYSLRPTSVAQAEFKHTFNKHNPISANFVSKTLSKQTWQV